MNPLPLKDLLKGCLLVAFFENPPVLPLFPTFYHNECFPLVLLEAMEHGLPCISTTEGGIPGIVDDGKTGFLVPKHDVAVLADKILLLLNAPVLRSNMGKAGREKFEKEFTLEVFEKRMVEILSNNVKC
jgi:glycosyltransferase involved in cell wall biosynthesis